jgi:hypothetical protein
MNIPCYPSDVESALLSCEENWEKLTFVKENTGFKDFLNHKQLCSCCKQICGDQITSLLLFSFIYSIIKMYILQTSGITW